jgi:hypothetical protein
MKTLPDFWTTEQKAYFAGRISAIVPRRQLMAVVDALSTSASHELYFDQLIAVLEPRISSYQWKRVAEHCEEVFA